MKNDLTCGVVQDLLPSYVEGLLGEESREAVERHLSACRTCAGKRDAMTAPAESAQDAMKEVDFLKQVKKRGRFRVFLAVLATFTVLLGAAALKIFVIGTPLQAHTVFCDVTEEDGVLHLLIASEGSGNALHGWTVETEDGIACVFARSVLVGLYKNGGGSVDIPLSDGQNRQEIREVWVGGKSGKLVWQDGTAISPQAMVLLDARSPYCGDPAALGRIAELLRLREHLGSYTASMETSQRPYRWTLEFKNQLNEEQRTYMIRAAYLMLALTDNLDEVAYTVPEPEEGTPAYLNGFFMGESISSESAAQGVKALTDEYNRTHFKTNRQDDWSAKASVKDYTRTPADFQRLLDILELL